MSVNEWIAVAGLLLAVLAAIYSSMRVIVRSIMTELSPNGGSSMKDQVNRIEERLDHLMLELSKR